MRRRTLIAVGIAAAVAGGVIYARLGGTAAPRPAIAVVERGSIERIVVASGTVEPEDLVEVRAKVSGIIERFHADDGDRVRAGEVIAEIDRETLEAAVREARAVLREAEVSFEHQERELARRSELHARGIESQDDIDRSRRDHAASEARRDRARATLERLEQELSWATVTAPIDGVVLRRDLNPGAAVASVATVVGGTVIMTIADTSKMHLLGVVDENDIAAVAVGMEARVQTDAHPGRVFPGRVRRIAALGDRRDNVTSFKVEITVLDGVEELRARLSADADIVAEVRRDALIVPETALLYDGDEIAVEVVAAGADGAVERRVVEAGVTQRDRVEILAGLREGEWVKLQ